MQLRSIEITGINLHRPRPGIFVAPAMNGHYHAGVKRLAQRRHLYLQGIVPYHYVWPDAVEELGLPDHRFSLVQQSAEDIEATRWKLYRSVRAEQLPFRAFQPVMSEVDIHSRGAPSEDSSLAEATAKANSSVVQDFSGSRQG